MTREDIVRSLKPIQWIYKHEFGGYSAEFGVGGRSLDLEIAPVLCAPPAEFHLTIFLNEEFLEKGYKKYHKNLDGAMKEARSFLVDEVCALFELVEPIKR